MRRRARDRRRNDGDFRVKPKPSPVTMLILTVTGVLLATAAASVIMGPRHESSTPHGQLLGTLDRVAAAQEAHYRAEGEFARWARTLQVAAPADVEVLLMAGSGHRWEAVAHHPVGLRCSQAGRIQEGRPVRDQPICFTIAPHEPER